MARNFEEYILSEAILVRDWNPEADTPFVLSTWLKSLYHGDSWFSLIRPRDAFFRPYHSALESLLAHPSSRVKVACLKSDPDTIVGYAVFSFGAPDHRILDFVYVKKAWRNIGVAKSLVPVDAINTVTHLTKTGISILYNHPAIQFNPFVQRTFNQ